MSDSRVELYATDEEPRTVDPAEEQWQEYKRLHPNPPKRVQPREYWELRRG